MQFFRRFAASFLTTLALLGFSAGFCYLSAKGEQKTGDPGFYAAAIQTAETLLYPEQTAEMVLAQTERDGQTLWQRLLGWSG